MKKILTFFRVMTIGVKIVMKTIFRGSGIKIFDECINLYFRGSIKK